MAIKLEKTKTPVKKLNKHLPVGLFVGFSLAFILYNLSDYDFFLNNNEDEEDNGPKFNAPNHSSKNHYLKGEAKIANRIAKKVRILCWVMTQPQNHKKKAQHIKATWGKHCNVLLFMSSSADSKLPTVVLNVHEGREYLWDKTRGAFTFIHKYYLNKADWFMKTDDDTFVIAENLRYFLLNKNSSKPVYYGCHFKPHVQQGYMSGGAGYVLSKEALIRFATYKLPQHCYTFAPVEDVEMGRCLEAVNVVPGDSRDKFHRGRFFPFIPEDHLIPQIMTESFWFWQYIYYLPKAGMECCSDTAVTFHYVPPVMMYVFDYLLYHLHPFGIQNLASENDEESFTSDNILFTATTESFTELTPILQELTPILQDSTLEIDSNQTSSLNSSVLPKNVF